MWGFEWQNPSLPRAIRGNLKLCRACRLKPYKEVRTIFPDRKADQISFSPFALISESRKGMESFEVQLADNAVVTGLAFLPRHNTNTLQKSSRPLIVAIHDATYSASYFFADAQHSALPLASALDIPFLAINRPGSQETTPLLPVPSGSTFLREEGKYLHQ